MTNLLIAFVIPILVIIVAAILQTILRCPYKVAGIIFVLLIIVALALGGSLTYIILAWFYTLIAFITALVVSRFMNNRDSDGCGCDSDDCNHCGCGCHNDNSNGCGCANALANLASDVLATNLTNINPLTNFTSNVLSTNTSNNTCGCANNNSCGCNNSNSLGTGNCGNNVGFANCGNDNWGNCNNWDNNRRCCRCRR